MKAFWLKMALLCVLALGLVVLVNVFPSRQEPAAQTQQPDRREQTSQTTEELQQARREREKRRQQSKAQTAQQQQALPEQQKQQPPARQTQQQQLNPQAEMLYQLAVKHEKMAHLPMMTFKKPVDYCREILERYPNSPQAPKARKLLREMPERYRKMYNITDEEMGIPQPERQKLPDKTEN